MRSLMGLGIPKQQHILLQLKFFKHFPSLKNQKISKIHTETASCLLHIYNTILFLLLLCQLEAEMPFTSGARTHTCT